MANNTMLRDGNGALFAAESFDQGGGLQRTSTAANLRVANADVATTNPVPVAPVVAGSPVSGSNPLPVSIGASSVTIGTVAVSTDAQANAAAPVATEGSSVPLSVDLARNLRVSEGSGAPVTGATMPAGGVGLTGWLSAIWSKLSGTLAVSGTVGISGTVPVSGTFWPTTQPVSVASLPALSAGTSTIGAVTSANPSTIACGQQTATTSAAVLPSQALVNGVNLIALAANTGIIYIGPSGVTTATGYPLSPGQTVPFAVTNLSAISMIGTNTSDKLAYAGN